MRVLPIFVFGAVIAAGAYGAQQMGLLDSIAPTEPSTPVVEQASAPPIPVVHQPAATPANGIRRPEAQGTVRSNSDEKVAQNNAASSSPPPPGKPAVDETALRYFASKGDTKRLQAEIARLKALYPQWTPPADPLAVQPIGDTELDRMWTLYSEGKLGELRKAIADRQQKEAGWTVPSDLLERLAVAESRDQLINASNLKQYQTVVRLASATPSLLTCAEIDVLWRVADAFVQTERQQRAIEAYDYVLANCADPAERLATMQKASSALPREELEKLLTREKTGPDGIGEFASVRDDLARRGVSAGGADPKLVVDPADVAAVERLARDGGLETDQLLLGWYYLRRDNAKAAEEWFRKARDTKNTAESSQGLALSLVALKRFSEAEDVLYQWRDGSDEILAVYLAATAGLLGMETQTPIASEILQRIVPVIYEARDVVNAQQLGWYALALNQFQTAAQWFSTALSWKPDDEPSAYGLVLTRARLGDRVGVRDIQAAWQGRSERIAQLGMTSTNPPGTPAAIPNVTLPPRATVPAGSDTNLPPSSLVTPYSATPVSPLSPVPAMPAQTGEAIFPNGAGATLPVTPQAAPAPVSPTEVRPARQARSGTAPARGCRSTIPPGSLSPQAALDRGWCLMNMNRPLEAAPAFEVALRSGSAKIRTDAAYGQSLAYLRAGLAREAAVAATKAPQDRQRTTELRTAILANQATEAFDGGRYVESLLALDERARIAPEQIDLMVLRGYAYLNLGRLGDAERVFEAVAATGSREGAKGLSAISDIRNPQGGG